MIPLTKVSPILQKGMTLDCQYLSSCVYLWGLIPRYNYVGVLEHCSKRLRAIEVRSLLHWMPCILQRWKSHGQS